MLPWIVFSFMAVLDFAYGVYGLIATQNAARVAAVWAAANSTNAQSANLTTTACSYALDSLRYAPGVGTATTTCGSPSPVSVQAQYSASGADHLPTVTVTVTYKLSMLGIPAIFPSTFTLQRAVQLPVRS